MEGLYEILDDRENLVTTKMNMNVPSKIRIYIYSFEQEKILDYNFSKVNAFIWRQSKELLG